MDNETTDHVILAGMCPTRSLLGGLLLLSLLSACASLFPSDHCQPEKKLFSETDFTVQTHLYTPAASKIEKTLIIFPPTGGTNVIDRSYARLFCKKGYQVYTIDGWSGENETGFDYELHQRAHSRAQKALTLLLKSVSTEFKALMGTSLGGLFSSTAAHVQPDLDAVFAITAGTPISEVIVYSDQAAMQSLHKNRKEKLGASGDAEQIQKIRDRFFLEPDSLGDSYKNKDLGLSIATQDTTVPTAQQQKLKNLWSPSKVIEINSDHFWGIVKTWLFHSEELVAFFETSYQKKKSQKQSGM